MKNWERILVYPLIICLATYAIWAHSKLNTLYRINRDRLVPAYEELQELKQGSRYMHSIPSSLRGTGNILQNLCNLLGELDLAARLKGPSLSEGTRNLLIARLSNNIKFQLNIKWFGRESKSFEKAIDLSEDAIQAEIDVLNYERQNPKICENGAWYSNQDYMRLMNKSISLRSEASFEVYRLMSKI